MSILKKTRKSDCRWNRGGCLASMIMLAFAASAARARKSETPLARKNFF
jgi:hypothetical protein